MLRTGGFFADSDSEEERDPGASAGFTEIYEIQELQLSTSKFQVRQFSWHRANANKVWPGTFVLAEYVDANLALLLNGKVLELGAATGALSLFLKSRGIDVITSDICDDGEVEANIRYNFELNGKSLIRDIFSWK